MTARRILSTTLAVLSFIACDHGGAEAPYEDETGGTQGLAGAAATAGEPAGGGASGGSPATVAGQAPIGGGQSAGTGSAGEAPNAAGAGGAAGELGLAGPAGGAPTTAGASAGGASGGVQGEAGSEQGGSGGEGGEAPDEECECTTGACCDGCHPRPSSFFCGEAIRKTTCYSAEGTATEHWNLFCDGVSTGDCTRWGARIKEVWHECPNGTECSTERGEAACR